MARAKLVRDKGTEKIWEVDSPNWFTVNFGRGLSRAGLMLVKTKAVEADKNYPAHFMLQPVDKMGDPLILPYLVQQRSSLKSHTSILKMYGLQPEF